MISIQRLSWVSYFCYINHNMHSGIFLGKLIGGFCALSGTFILTLPIPIVVNSFAGYYKNRLWRNEVAQKKRERAMAQATEAREMQKLYLVQAMAGPLAREGISIGNGDSKKK